MSFAQWDASLLKFSKDLLAVTKLLTGSVDNDASGSVSPGDRLDYSVTAQNTGNVPLGNVLVSDNHFAATTSCASLAVNATCALTGSYTVAASDDGAEPARRADCACITCGVMSSTASRRTVTAETSDGA